MSDRAIPLLMDEPDGQPSEGADISRRAVRLGRYLDRLPDGEYVLMLTKEHERWRVNVLDANTRRILDLLR